MTKITLRTPLETQSTQRSGSRWVLACLFLLLTTCVGPSLPSGEWLLASGASLRTSLEEVASLEETKVGKWALAQLDSLPSCDSYWRHCPRGRCPSDSLFSCNVDDSTINLPPGLLDEWDWGYQLPLTDSENLLIRGTLQGGLTHGEVSIPPSLVKDAFLFPSKESPAPPIVSPHRRILHLLVRPAGGLSVADLAQDDGWAAKMFALKSELFTATALEGTLELAMYEPSADQMIPPLVLALPVINKDLAKKGMETFVREIKSRWPIHTTPLTDAEGECLIDFHLLPDLVPCYRMTEDALVVGWNIESLRAASASPPGERFAVNASHLEIDFEALARADATLRNITAANVPGMIYPWSKLRVAAVPDKSDLLIRFEIAPIGDRPPSRR